MAILALIELDCVKMDFKKIEIINIFAKIIAICNKVIYSFLVIYEFSQVLTNTWLCSRAMRFQSRPTN